MDYFYNFCLEKISSLLSGKKKILELGGSSPILKIEAKKIFPRIEWHQVQTSDSGFRRRWDHFFSVHNNNEKKFDAIIFTQKFEKYPQIQELLRNIRVLTTEEAFFLCSSSNASHYSFLINLLLGESHCEEESWSKFSYSAIFKILLNFGWLPNLLSTKISFPEDAVFTENLITFMQKQGIPKETAKRYLASEQLIIGCRKRKDLPEKKFKGSSVSVVVPVNNPKQFINNVASSPGLREIGAQLILSKNPCSAAQAWEEGRRHAKHDWIIFCHQDVYFPEGSGIEILSKLAEIPKKERAEKLIGFCGLSESERKETEKSGLAIDRVYLFDFPETLRAISMDEFAIILSKDTNYAIDRSLGWHLWATDLCLQGIHAASSRYGHIIKIPVFHNSYNDGVLGRDFYESVQKLLKKYPERNVISTLCGAFYREKERFD